MHPRCPPMHRIVPMHDGGASAGASTLIRAAPSWCVEIVPLPLCRASAARSAKPRAPPHGTL